MSIADKYSQNCSSEFDPLWENLKYALQASYLVPTLFLLIWMVFTVRVRYHDHYRYNLAFWIFTVDCLASILFILMDLSMTRLFLHFPQFCPTVSRYLIAHPVITAIYYPLYNYIRATKPVTQCALILTRVDIIAHPIGQELRWRKRIPVVILIILLLPLLVIWNTVVSEKKLIYWYGGFMVIYTRFVKWASLSSFHVINILVAITVILGGAYRILRRNVIPKPKIRSFIMSTSLVIFGFVLQAVFQSYFAFFRDSTWFPSIIVEVQFVIYDVLTVGVPLMTLHCAGSFRWHVFHRKSRQNFGQLMLPNNEKTVKRGRNSRKEDSNSKFDSILP